MGRGPGGARKTESRDTQRELCPMRGGAASAHAGFLGKGEEDSF